VAGPVLIRNAEIWGQGLANLRIEGGVIAEIDRGCSELLHPQLKHIDARGAALLPGLHDHHIHLAGLAARSASVWCGPPDVMSADRGGYAASAITKA
jgi:predicted amidohydrolase YtcJ